MNVLDLLKGIAESNSERDVVVESSDGQTFKLNEVIAFKIVDEERSDGSIRKRHVEDPNEPVRLLVEPVKRKLILP